LVIPLQYEHTQPKQSTYMNKLSQSDLLNSDIKQISTPVINTINSQHLLNQKGIANIYHQGEIYQLRQTRAGKLILTK